MEMTFLVWKIAFFRRKSGHACVDGPPNHSARRRCALSTGFLMRDQEELRMTAGWIQLCLDLLRTQKKMMKTPTSRIHLMEQLNPNS
jgi:hypothetical protein